MTAVNDHHVLKAWAEATGAAGHVDFLADGNGDFAKALGLDLDLSAGGLGLRSKRYSMLVADGVVKLLNVEPDPGKVDFSGSAVRGNPHAAFDEAGAANAAWSRWCDTRRRKSEPTGNTNFDLNRRACPRP